MNEQAGLLPVIDVLKCNKCDKCVSVCLQKAIVKSSNFACSKCIKYCLSIEVPCNPDNYVFCYEQCNSCGDCVLMCPHKAIYWYKLKKQ